MPDRDRAIRGRCVRGRLHECADKADTPRLRPKRASASIPLSGRSFGEAQDDQRLGFGHLPRHRVHRVPPQALQTADAFVAIDDDIRGVARHDNDRDLLAGLGKRGQEPPFPGGVAYAQLRVAQIELLKFQLHRREQGRQTCQIRRTGPRSTAHSCPQTMQCCGRTRRGTSGPLRTSLVAGVRRKEV